MRIRTRRGARLVCLMLLVTASPASSVPQITPPDVHAKLMLLHRGLELIRQRTITRLARGQEPGPEASISKIVSASKQQSISSFGLDLLEVTGTNDTVDTRFDRGFLDSPGNRIAGGTDEVLRNIIAERVLGLPGDIRVDRERAFRDTPSGPQR